jgi:hypothetical protein
MDSTDLEALSSEEPLFNHNPLHTCWGMFDFAVISGVNTYVGGTAV